MRITCDRCGKVQDGQRGEARLKRSDMLIRDIIDRMRHDRMRRQGWCGWSRSGKHITPSRRRHRQRLI
jgi:hypothetical protein